MASLIIGNPTKTLAKNFNTFETNTEIISAGTALANITNSINRIYSILYDEKFDNKKNLRKNIVTQLTEPESNLFSKISINLHHYDHNCQSKAAAILSYVVLRSNQEHNTVVSCIKSNPQMIISLLKDCRSENLAVLTFPLLKDICKRCEITDFIVDKIKIPTNLDSNNDVYDDDDGDYNCGIVKDLFVLTHNASFIVSINAYETLNLLLTCNQNRNYVQQWLIDDKNYLSVFINGINQCIKNGNQFHVQVSFLKFLYQLLAIKQNRKQDTMIRYISDKSNLKIIMKLLTSKRKSVAFESYHIFAIFVCNPNKSRPVLTILRNNKEKIMQLLTRDVFVGKHFHGRELILKKIKQLIPFTLPWKKERILWIGYMKNDENAVCCLSKVPKDIVKMIITFVKNK